MKNLNTYITEKILINKNTKTYSCQPKNKDELKKIIKERLEKDKDADLNDIDVSKITDMRNLFYELNPHNIKIDKWDVSNVKDMGGMFLYCGNFEGNGLENWDVSNVENMSYIFYNCENFDCDLSSWNVSNVKNMTCMFYKCENFNCDLSEWYVSNIKYIGRMFDECNSLKNKPSWYKN